MNSYWAAGIDIPPGEADLRHSPEGYATPQRDIEGMVPHGAESVDVFETELACMRHNARTDTDEACEWRGGSMTCVGIVKSHFS